MTFNHARFIDQAVQGALSQRTAFDFEVLISEDCSTDGTRQKVIEWQRGHPSRIRLLLSDHNLRSNAVVARGLRAARGEYVAMLDGDDYWTADDKLQRQADFLDAHPGCAMCFHNARVVDETGLREPRNWTPPEQPPVSTLEDIWMGNFIAMCSTMFRRATIAEPPRWYEAMFPITDWPLHILAACHGDIGYLDEVMGIYRHHGGGMYSPYSTLEKIEMTRAFYRTMKANLGRPHAAAIRRAQSKYLLEWAEEFARRGDLSSGRHCFRGYLRGGSPLNRYISVRRALKVGAALWLRGGRAANPGGSAGAP
jgi:glycosyltransferase involved in cell wall biosynthesis